MITIDTWAVISADKDNITLECPFQDGNPCIVSVEWFGFAEEHDFHVGDILTTETGGMDYLKYKELDDITKEGRKTFYAYIKKKGFHYSFLEKYGFIADP